MTRHLLVLAISVLISSSSLQAQTADLIYNGGTIITIDAVTPQAEAVAVKDGKILAVGKKEDVLKTKGETTKLIDVKGRTMLPGFVDAHGHVTGGGLQALSANMLAPPDGDVTDIASLQQTLRDWMSENQQAVDKIQLVVGFGYDNTQLAEAGEFKIDVVSYPDVLVDREMIKNEVSPTYKNRFRVAGAKLTIDGSPQGFTAWRDRPYYKPVGSYPPGYSGYAAATPAQVGDAVDWAYSNNIQILTHCNGEASSDQLIAFIAGAGKKHGGDDRRSVLIHGQFLREDQVDALNRLEILPSLFPMHTFYWGDWHREHTVGPELADNISPTGWCVKRGMKFTSHHDAPVAFPDSMRVLDATVTRHSRSGDITGPAQRVDVMTALKAMPTWPAWQHFEENSKGSIEVGKLADFVILDKNPLEMDPETLDQIKVTETIKEGVSVYKMTESPVTNWGHNRVFPRMVLAISNASMQVSETETTSPPCSNCLCGGLSRLMEIIAGGEVE